MALTDLIGRLEQDAAREIAAIAAGANAAAAALEEETDRAIAERSANLRAQAGESRETAQRQHLAELHLRHRARELEAQHALIQRIVDRARQFAAETATSTDYLRVLPEHLREALAYVEDLPVIVRCAPAHQPIVAPLVSARGHATVAADSSIAAGIVVEAEDGSVTIDNTLMARLERAASRHAAEMSRGDADVR